MTFFQSSFALAALIMQLGGAAQGRRPDATSVNTCESISLARLGFGASYRGTVRNDDYRLSFTIPPRLTGWGADPVAPFHGFTIFLPSDPKVSSCIVFEIHLRVVPRERTRKSPGIRAKIGDRAGWKQEMTGTVDGNALTNVTIRFSIRRDTEVYDGQVWLVTPSKDVDKNVPILNDFLSQIRFDQ